MGAKGRRWLVGLVGALVVLAALGAAALLLGIWRPVGTTVELVETSPSIFAGADGGQGLLVCAEPGAWASRGAEREPVYLRIGPATVVLDRRGRLLAQPASLADLQPGQRLSVWDDGGVMFSYPAQVVVAKLVIEEDGAANPAQCPLKGLEP